MTSENSTTRHEKFHDRNHIEIVSEKTVRTLIAGPELYRTSRPTIEERRNPVCLRIYRCSICFEKFKMKEECLRHIILVHPQVKKPVSSNTIFESIYKKSDEGPPQFLSKQKLELLEQNEKTALETKNRNNEKPTEDTYNKQNASTGNAVLVSPEKILSKKTENSETAVKPKISNRHRKVLAIDAFFKEIHKKVSRYVCDVCGRAMASKFAFQRHLHEHDPDNDEVLEEKSEVKVKPLRARVGYCKLCKKLVSHYARHKMYHTISQLETDYPNVVKLLGTT